MTGTWGGVVLLLIGSSAAAFGGSLVWTGASSPRYEGAPVAATGIVVGALGLTFDAWTLWHLFGPSRETIVYP